MLVDCRRSDRLTEVDSSQLGIVCDGCMLGFRKIYVSLGEIRTRHDLYTYHVSCDVTAAPNSNDERDILLARNDKHVNVTGLPGRCDMAIHRSHGFSAYVVLQSWRTISQPN